MHEDALLELVEASASGACDGVEAAVTEDGEELVAFVAQPILLRLALRRWLRTSRVIHLRPLLLCSTYNT